MHHPGYGVSMREINPITEITHSPLYPMVLLTIYLFAIGFTIGNYTGYFRFNTDIYGSDFVRAYLAFTVIGTGCFFFISGVCWLWAAKYVHTIESRLRKLTIGFCAIFLFHDLPCFSMELHAILEHGWRNGYQGFVFVFQIITFLISFTNGWLYYTWVMAAWLQYWYGYPHESFGLKTGQEQLAVLPPMSPVEGGGVRPSLRSGSRGGHSRRNSRSQPMSGGGINFDNDNNKEMIIGVGPSTPMLGSGLRWNSQQSGNSQQQYNQPSPTPSGSRSSYGNNNNNNSNTMRRNSRPNTPTNRRSHYDFDNPDNFNNHQNNNNNNQFNSGMNEQEQDNILFSSQTRMEAPNSGLRRSNPPGAFLGSPASGSNNGNSGLRRPAGNNNNNNYNFREQNQNNFRSSGGIRLVDGLEEEQQQQPIGENSSRSTSLYQNNNNNNNNNQYQQQPPVSLMQSPMSNAPASRTRYSNSGNYVQVSPSATSQASNSDWRELPAVTSGAGPNNNNIMWNSNRKMML